MPAKFIQGQEEILPEVLHTIMEEFKNAGIASGIFIVGVVADDPAKLCLLWYQVGDVDVAVKEARTMFESLEGARTLARQLVEKWLVRHEREMRVRDRIGSAWARAAQGNLEQRAPMKFMNNVKTWRSVGDLVAEGEKLLRSRPYCHKMRNDLTAAILMHKMHAKGFEVAIEQVEQCIRRMRIAVDTGIYPDRLLAQASAERTESMQRLVTNG